MPNQKPQAGDSVRVRIGELNLLGRIISATDDAGLIQVYIAAPAKDFQGIDAWIPDGYDAPYKWEVEVSWR